MILDFRAALIDLDGNLVDSESLKARALADAVAVYGGRVEPDIYKDVMGSDWQVVRAHFMRVAHLDIAQMHSMTPFVGFIDKLLNSVSRKGRVLAPFWRCFDAMKSGSLWLAQRLVG